ncbi:MAG: AMIN domain-containing protein, partial [Microcystaceae cyanobacterium]
MLKKLGCFAVSLLVVPMLAVGAWAGSLDYWKFDLQDSRLDIVTDENVRPQVQLLANPTRLVIDL